MCYAIGPLIASRKLAGPAVGMTAVCLAFAAVVLLTAGRADLDERAAVGEGSSPRSPASQ